MIKAQQELLANLRAAERHARKIYDAGVKIGGVVQKLRAAADELETRVRYLERTEKPAPPAPKPKPAPLAPEPKPAVAAK